MSLLTHPEIMNLVSTGAIRNADPANVNSVSLDVRLGPEVLIESTKLEPAFEPLALYEGDWVVEPGATIKVSTLEVFDLPPDIGAILRLRSGIANKRGLSLPGAEWGDPGWTNGAYTVTLTNRFRYRAAVLRPGECFAQIIFIRGSMAAPDEHSYAAKGNHNHTPTLREEV
jgi:deoxycytidine triphosphate deaminase